jgi:hypothetical protein
MTPPIIVPPAAPKMRMGAYAFVMIASGRLSKSPNAKPIAQPGQASTIQPMTTPMPKRFKNAPVNAAYLSGNDKGNIDPAEMAPKTIPATTSHSGLDIVASDCEPNKKQPRTVLCGALRWESGGRTGPSHSRIFQQFDHRPRMTLGRGGATPQNQCRALRATGGPRPLEGFCRRNSFSKVFCEPRQQGPKTARHPRALRLLLGA